MSEAQDLPTEDFPGDGPDEAPAKLPLDGWHRGKGARMVEFAGYEMPIQFEGIVAEHEWTREQASLFDVSHMGQLLVSGERAAEELKTEDNKMVWSIIMSWARARCAHDAR